MDETKEYILNKKHLQEYLLNYIDHEEDLEEHYQTLITFFQDKHFHENKTELKILFKMITKIANHHYRSTDFFSKIEKIILYFKNEIPKYFTNSELFNIFRRNNRILLFLLEEKLIQFTYYVFKNISYYENDFYYFYPEIIHYNESNRDELLKDKKKETIEFIENNPDEFQKLRKTGENDSLICQLIRKDDIDGFTAYIKQNKIKIRQKKIFEIESPTKIQESFYETNSYLNSNRYTLDFINYACFFGSVKIFKYMFMELNELFGDLWEFAIHGRNMEIIHFLEQQRVEPLSNFSYESEADKYTGCFDFAMKNFHNEVADYLFKCHIKRKNAQVCMAQSGRQNVLRPNFMQPNFIRPFYLPPNYFLQQNLVRPGFMQPCYFPPNFVRSKRANQNMPNILQPNLPQQNIQQNNLQQQNVQQNNLQQNLPQQNIQQNNLQQNLQQQNSLQQNIQQILPQQNVQQNNLQQQQDDKDDELFKYAIKYLNFAYFPHNIKDKYCFIYLCRNGILDLVDYVIDNANINDFFYDPFLGTFDIKDLLHKVVEKEQYEVLGRLYGARPFDPNMLVCQHRGSMHITESLLHTAVKRDNAQIAQFMLSFDNINVNQIYWEDNYSSYDVSPNNGEEEDESDSLFDHDLDDCCCVTVKKTALHLAVENKNKEIVSLLLKHPKINVNILKLDLKYLYDRMHGTESTRKTYKTRFILTALLTAIENDDIEIIRLLLSSPHIDVNKKCKFDYRYEYHYHGRKRRGKDENHNRSSCGHEFKTPLFYAIEKGKSIEIIKLLLSHDGIDINLESTFIDNNQDLLDFMKKMIDEDMNPNDVVNESIKIKEITKTPLEMAYYKQNTEVSDLLLGNKKIDVNYKSGGEQIFKNAVKEGDMELIKSYLAIPGFNIKKALKGTLQIAIQNDNIGLFNFLLNLPEINVNDKLNGKTPLQVASEKENIEVVQILLNRPEIKFDLNTVFSDIDDKKIQIISLLLDAKKKSEHNLINNK